MIAYIGSPLAYPASTPPRVAAQYEAINARLTLLAPDEVQRVIQKVKTAINGHYPFGVGKTTSFINAVNEAIDAETANR